MPISKKYLKSKSVCKVTSKVEGEAVLKAKKVELLGSFNDWKPSKETLMKKLKDGSFTKTIDLTALRNTSLNTSSTVRSGKTIPSRTVLNIMDMAPNKIVSSYYKNI